MANDVDGPRLVDKAQRYLAMLRDLLMQKLDGNALAGVFVPTLVHNTHSARRQTTTHHEVIKLSPF